MADAMAQGQPPYERVWRRMVRPLIYVVGMIPAVWTFTLGLIDQLGADPLNTLERSLGLWALRFLVIGLAITPLRRLGGPNLTAYRRAVGLLAFIYATLHLTVYLVLDQGLDLNVIINDIVRRPYITVGMIGFLVLIPLAVTSNNALVKRMGAQAWRKLHRLVYLAAIAGALHFVLLVKAWPPEPLIYAAIITALLMFRLFDRRKRRPLRDPTRSSPLPSRAEVAPVPTVGIAPRQAPR